MKGHADATSLLHVAHPSTARVQEMHITCLHILCALFDREIFGL